MFLRQGFHGASLDEIAEAAGYTTGAVYSNFKGKDDLFLAVLDAEATRRFPLHTEALLTARWETEFTLPAREVVRGIYYLSRGCGQPVALDPRLGYPPVRGPATRGSG